MRDSIFNIKGFKIEPYDAGAGTRWYKAMPCVFFGRNCWLVHFFRGFRRCFEASRYRKEAVAVRRIVCTGGYIHCEALPDR
jgi:hypothetical protein